MIKYYTFCSDLNGVKPQLISKGWVFLGASQNAREEYLRLHGDASNSVTGRGEDALGKE